MEKGREVRTKGVQAVRSVQHGDRSLPEPAGDFPAKAPQKPESLPLSERLALSPAEAAQTLGVSENHLRSLLRELAQVHLGRRVVIPVDALTKWLGERARSEASRVDAAVKEILDGIK